MDLKVSEGNIYVLKSWIKLPTAPCNFHYNRSRLMPPRVHSSLEDRYSTFTYSNDKIFRPLGDHRPIRLAVLLEGRIREIGGSNFISSTPSRGWSREKA